ncbi:MAG: PAP2 family protein [Candidatus Roizmanbacteria bacterium GW2011_GWC2_41_7]|uniref:PAP2 family protein n=1 Tax=Candidatus Roizmanbacteria bacterium GW2011_GWC2_41_7 TaxID=1618487 RepID=A0A0G0X2Z7_9BACT|nr:MAG: PAP2 family protein [Candidatus Roizmanbacteria bacterium GW2011_GWC2_41_7]
MSLDIKIFYFFNNLAEKWPIFDTAVIFLADYFGYFVAAFFIAILFLASFHKDKSKIFLTVLTSVVLSRLIITEIIRFLYCRPRPFMAYAVSQLVDENHCSFPSGHAAFFFAMAMAIYFYNKKLGAWFFAAAILIALARVAAGVHYPTDILAGAVIGVLSACAVFYFVKK